MGKIELITCPSGDWEILLLDGKYFTSGHQIRAQDWLYLLKCMSCEVVEREISDCKMEVEDWE